MLRDPERAPRGTGVRAVSGESWKVGVGAKDGDLRAVVSRCGLRVVVSRCGIWGASSYV